MKKIVLALLSLLVLSSAAYAKSGDIAGEYYSTDIHTILNGIEIDSINIGGRTLISAENMSYYSFGVYWDEQARRLDISREDHPDNGTPPVVKKSNYPSGNVIGNYYETDIVTYLDGDAITAYNVGGRTYILAEEMADFGYEVIWNENDRSLLITSPDRAGYDYSIFLSYGTKPETEEYSSDGTGAFSILRNADGIIGKGDANRLNATLSCDGKGYTLHTAFYQNAGLFHSLGVQDLMQSFVSSGRGMEPINPEEKYDLINQNAQIVINGHAAQKVTVVCGGGNGHYDFAFCINDIPLYKKDDIKEIYVSVGNTEGLDTYKITEQCNDYSQMQQITESLKKTSEDYVQTTYDMTSDNCFVVFMKEAKSWGVYKDCLYLVNWETKAVSEDVLEQVRQIDGYNYDIINPFNFHIGDVKTNLFFSCNSEERTGDFYVETDTGKVHLITDHAK